MPRGFDRTDGDYAPIEILLDDKLKGYLDRLLELSIPPTEFEAVLDRPVFVTTRTADGTLGATAPGLTLSGSERARLRLALWFWNGAWVKLRHEDFLQLDVNNTHRLVRALGRFLRVVVVSGLYQVEEQAIQAAEAEGDAQRAAEEEARAQAEADRDRDRGDEGAGPQGDPDGG